MARSIARSFLRRTVVVIKTGPFNSQTIRRPVCPEKRLLDVIYVTPNGSPAARHVSMPQPDPPPGSAIDPGIPLSDCCCVGCPYCFVATYVLTRPVSLLVSTAVIVLPLAETVIVVTSVTVPSRLSVSTIVLELTFSSETASQP